MFISFIHIIFPIARKLLAILLVFVSFQSIAQKSEPDSNSFGGQMASQMERMVNMFEFKNKRITASALPGIAYDPESAWEFGFVTGISVKPKDSTMYYRPSSASTYFSYSTNNWLRAKLSLQYFSANGFYTKIISRFMNTPDTFWGIGNDDIPIVTSEFTLRNFEFNLQLGKSIKNILYLGINSDISLVNTLEITDSVLNKSIPGYFGGTSIGFGPFIRIDTRDNVNYPHKGILIDWGTVFYNSFFKNDYTMQMYTLKFSTFSRLLSDLILCTNTSLAVVNGEVPFYKMPQLAGNSYLRGISNRYKYIDDNCFYIQTELRKQLWWRLGGVAFAGVGNNFSDWNDDILHPLKWICGVGGRFSIAPQERLNLRLDIGFGSNSDHGVYMSISEAF